MKNISSLFTKKRIIYGVVALVVLMTGYFIFFNKETKQETITAHAGDFLQQVSVSGKVIPTQNLDLSFEQPGLVRGVYVKVGDQVGAGKFLVSQDTMQLSAQLQEMQAGIELQKARLNQLLAGSSSEDIKIKSDAVILAKQDVQNAYDSAWVSLNSAYNAIYDALTVAYYTQITYFNSPDQEGVKVQNSYQGISVSLTDAKNSLDNGKNSQSGIDLAITSIVADLNNTYTYLKTVRDQCDIGIYYTRVSATDKTSLDTQKSNINAALTTLASSKESINSYKSDLQQAQNQLGAISAPSRPTDIAVFEAQIKQAEASAQGVLAQIRKRQIFSPINGTVTQVNAKVGSSFSSGQVAVSVISTGRFEVESYVPEIYISLVKIGNDVEVVLDAYGSDKIFKAKVVSIDPSETLKDGISTYKTTLQFTEDSENIKSGMSATATIITKKKEHVISIPQGLIIIEDDKKMVKVLQGESIIEKEVQVGDISSLGQIEIVSGIDEGEVIVVK